ncbi:MAG: tetratricopeptide repeat protein [Myxococcota bacterium]
MTSVRDASRSVPWTLASFAAVVLLATAAGAIEDDDAPLPTDPRVIEANSLLGEESQRDHVIGLYGEVLAERPDDRTARMWLARVLSWDAQYDASLAHYEWFLRSPEPPDWAAPERAAVLSWAGRYEEAEIAYEELLARDPNDAAAALGLARVYQWSGRSREAAKAYERALAIQDDAGARTELEALYGSRETRGESTSRYFSDSDDFTLTETTIHGSSDLGFDTTLLGRTTYFYVATDRKGDREFDPLADEDESTQGFDAVAGVRHRFAQSVVASLLVGGRRWEGAPATALVEAQVEWTVTEQLATGFRVDYGDFLGRSHSIDAVLEGVEATTLRGWAWAQVHPMVSAYGFLETTFLENDQQTRQAEVAGEDAALRASGSNNRLSWGGDLAFAPFPKYDLRLVLGNGYSRYRDDSELFYDPSFEVDGTFGLAGSHQVTDWLAIDGEVFGGYGYSDQDGQDGEGPTYRVALGTALMLGGLRVDMRGERSESRRGDSSYETWGATLGMGMRF